MTDLLFERPILNSPYEPLRLHHALGDDGQPTELPPLAGRRPSKLLTPVPRGRGAKTKQSRPDLAAAAREATEPGFDVLIACAFNYEAHAASQIRLGALPILQAWISPTLFMAGELKNTGKGNLFTVFGEPDIAVEHLDNGLIQIRINGVDVFDPNTGDIRSSDTDGIAAWLIDTDYDEESFFVRHAYFLGANDPYKSLKTALKAEIDEDAWSTLYRAVSRPFSRPSTGRIAVKVINHFGDEVMKVFSVGTLAS